MTDDVADVPSLAEGGTGPPVLGYRSAYARVLRASGDLDGAAEIYEDVLSRAETADRPSERAWGLDGLARVRYLRGDVVGAGALADEALQLYEDVGYVEGLTSALDILGLVAIAEGDLDRARSYLGRGAELGQRMGHRGSLAATLEACARLAEAGGDLERAARLLGCAEGLHAALGAVAGVTDELVARRLRERLSDALGDRSEELRREGRGLSLDDAVRLATETS